MPSSYSLDLRRRVMADVASGLSIELVGRKYSICSRVIFQWRDLLEETGSLEPRRGKTGPKRKLDSYRDSILSAVEENSSITLQDLKAKLNLPGCIPTLWNSLRRWGIVLKKKSRGRLSSNALMCRNNVAGGTFWCRASPSRILSSSTKQCANTKMIRRYGWGLKSDRVIGKVPHGHWKTTTFLAALRYEGLTAPLVVDGPMNGDVFLAYVQQQLLPTLGAGEVVVMDNLGTQESRGPRSDRVVRGKSCLPAALQSRPEPDRIAFAKLKTLLRKSAARTVEHFGI